ncbi:MAG: maltose alpha-D-glucosyltransferase, partial [Acidobacteriota bacterium]
VIYQLHVRSFFDSDGNGVGDFRGLTEKLDYLQNLGVTAIWLLPFYPSPLRDDGYDIADYSEVNPTFGTLKDFRLFLEEAHRRGLRIITELVINHTSDQHPWFQRSRNAKPGSNARNFYVWSDSPDKYKEARIIFKDFETSNWSWDPVARSYYWHRFYHHQPDLNFDNPQVRKALFEVLDFWMEMGVDGLRLDAVPYLYEREGTTSENLPETHAYLKELRSHVDRKFRNRMLLAEANQWPEDSRPYFGDGDECHVAFHFPLMPRLFMSLAQEDRFPIVDIMQQTPAIPDNCQWAVFLRNHDELTLEMVTDEDRDYMWRTYAADPQARINLGIRRRLAPLVNNHRRRIELLNGLLFSFPGTPIIYYGDEIGMGDNIYLGDRHGVRTPMQWSADRNAGFSRSNPQRLFLPIIIDPEYHYEAINVEAQQGNSYSLLWWTKRLIDLRKRFKAFGRGSLEFLHPDNRKVLVFIRKYEDEQILVIANLSRFVQSAELDLTAYQGMIPEELFGHAEFPAITELPYVVTLGPHDFYWFLLKPGRPVEVTAAEKSLPTVAADSLEAALHGRPRTQLAGALASYIRTQRWFAGKARDIKSCRILDCVDVEQSSIILLQVDYTEGTAETYVIPVAVAEGSKAMDVPQHDTSNAIARMRSRSEEPLLLYEAVWNREFGRSILGMIGRRKQSHGAEGSLAGLTAKGAKLHFHADDRTLEPRPLRAEQSNTSILFGDKFFLKLFRRVDAGVSLDYEINKFLSERTHYPNVPALVGALEYRRSRGEPSTLAILQRYVKNNGDAWKYTLGTLGLYFENVVSRTETDRKVLTVPRASLVELSSMEMPPSAVELLGTYGVMAALMGQRIGELHVALSSDSKDPAFRPEPFTPHYQRSIYQHMRTQATQALQPLKRKLRTLPETVRPAAEALIARETEIQERFRSLLARKIAGLRIRAHGDLHLGQLLFTGKDFMVIDFEGEPARPLSERRIKRSPIRDVAGMLRSFSYAAETVRLGAGGVRLRTDDADLLREGSLFWERWISATFLRSYLEAAAPGGFLPSTDELEVVLNAYVFEKALYELVYELNNRPEWIRIPIEGMLRILTEQD